MFRILFQIPGRTIWIGAPSVRFKIQGDDVQYMSNQLGVADINKPAGRYQVIVEPYNGLSEGFTTDINPMHIGAYQIIKIGKMVEPRV